jgi:hypothetical protein
MSVVNDSDDEGVPLIELKDKSDGISCLVLEKVVMTLSTNVDDVDPSSPFSL